MNTKLKLEKHQLFKEICPVWYEVFKQTENMSTQQIYSDENLEKIERIFNADIIDGARCVMGEAHGWNDDYETRGKYGYCKQCDNIATGDNNDNTLVDAFGNPSIRDKVITRFEKHWSQVHK